MSKTLLQRHAATALLLAVTTVASTATLAQPADDRADDRVVVGDDDTDYGWLGLIGLLGLAGLKRREVHVPPPSTHANNPNLR